MKVRVWIGLGGNLPGTLEAMAVAREALRTYLMDPVFSSIHHTPPWGNPFQPPFWNQVASGFTYRSVREVFAFLQALEHRLGRRREGRWEARLLDLDLLLYGDRVIRHPDLYLPHPWIPERLFVLDPVLELANPLHPETGQTFCWHRMRLYDLKTPQTSAR